MDKNPLPLVPHLYKKGCDKLNIPYRIINKEDGQLIIGNRNKQIYIRQLYNNFNDNNIIKLVRDKYKTYEILKKHNLPVPEFQLIDMNNFNSIDNVISQIKIRLPIVIKQIDGANGDLVFVNLNSKKDIENSIDQLIKRNKNLFLVEKYVRGNDYRILIFNNKIIDIIHRPFPYIIGDGIHSIKELIDLKNTKLIEKGFHPIKIDKIYCEGKNIDLSSILTKNKKQKVNQLTNFHQGSEPTRIEINKVHPDNIDLFLKISKLLHLKYSGIDFICNDIKSSYLHSNNIINEVNGLPNLDIHYYADDKKKNYTIPILKNYFNLV